MPLKNLEEELNKWVLDLRRQGYVVTRSSIRLQALKMAKEERYDVPPDFKASAGWCTRFMNLNGLTLRTKTHIAQHLSSDVEDKVTNFHKFVISERKKHEFSLNTIGNMDETPMTFDLPSHRTVDSIGAKSVNIKICGADKAHFTVVLACMADGQKLKPLVIFKRKTMPKEKMPDGLIVKVHEKDWMDEKLMNEWINEVWTNRPGALIQRKSLLVWDMFRGHLVDSVKKISKEKKTFQAVIPGGCTSILQPLDVGIIKPFKTHMRSRWTEWMIGGQKEYTAAGNIKRPSLQKVCEWTKVAWEKITAETIQKSFKKCGISNAMDGTEDELFFEDLVSRNSNTSEEIAENIPASDKPDESEESFDELDEIYDDCVNEEEAQKLDAEERM